MMKTTMGTSSFGKKVIRTLLRLMGSRRRALAGQQTNAEIVAGDGHLAVTQRDVQFSDFAAVAKLKEQSGLGTECVENWDWLWRRNAAVAKAKSPLSMGWVLEAGGRIVGYQGSVPLLYHYGDRVLIAATGTGLAVEPPYRARSIGLLASFYRQKNIDFCLITTASESVGKMSKLFKAETVPQRDYQTTLFWVLDTHKFAKAILKKFDMASNVERFVAVMVSLAMQTEMIIRSKGPRGISPNFHVTEIKVHQIGDEFDTLWRRKLKEKPCLLADRSQTSLRWHFTVPGYQGETVVLCCHCDGRLVGYAVIQSKTEEKIDLRRCSLIDMLVEGDDPHVTESLLAAAYVKARTSSCHVFEVLGFPRRVRKILARWTPYSRTLPACPFVFKVTDPALHAILEDEDAWYASPFDGDTTLMPFLLPLV